MAATMVSFDSFLGVLRQSKLLAEEQVRALAAEFKASGGDGDGAAFEKFLVEKQQITAWQGDKLLQGVHKGFTLGKYRLLKHLGSGGMSSVYLGEHLVMKRLAAIKVLPKARVEDSSFLERFLLEARAVASLDHPNIVKAYNVDNEGNTHYLVMEYVEGEDLEKVVLKDGPMTYQNAAECIRQAADGLAHAHQRGMIHRDIKPSNLLRDQHDVVKILDMGLAKLLSSERSLTVEHNEKVLGTTDYLAPEQAINSSSVDHRADIYSLGCTLYFLLSGGPPFPTGTLAQRLLKHQVEEPKALSEHRPDVPEGLVAICSKMMAKKADRRYQTAAQVRDALRIFLHGEVDPSASSVASTSEPTPYFDEPAQARTVVLRDGDTDVGVASSVAVDAPSSINLAAAPLSSQRTASGSHRHRSDASRSSAPALKSAPQDKEAAAWKLRGALAGGAIVLGLMAIGLGFFMSGSPVKGKIKSGALGGGQEIAFEVPRAGTYDFRLKVTGAESDLVGSASVRSDKGKGPPQKLAQGLKLSQLVSRSKTNPKITDLGRATLPAGPAFFDLRAEKRGASELAFEPWRILGPLPRSGDPKQLPAWLKGPVDYAKDVPGASAPNVKWEPIPLVDYQENALKSFVPWGEQGNSYCYLHRVATSPSDRKVKLRFQRDDRMIVWVNQKTLVTQLDDKGYEQSEVSADAWFKKGKNEILVYLGNDSGPWRIAFSDGPSLNMNGDLGGNVPIAAPRGGLSGPSFSYEVEYELVR